MENSHNLFINKCVADIKANSGEHQKQFTKQLLIANLALKNNYNNIK